MSKRCVVLGAGFSRAVSKHMPVTNELGKLVLEALPPAFDDFSSRDFASSDFEAWLSRLAEPQPDLRDYENLRNQAAFARISEVVREVLVGRQQLVMASAPPLWLDRFVRIAHAERPTVISFNYDTILEAAVNGPVFIQDQATSTRVGSSDLVDGLPPLAQPLGSTFAETRTDSFKLLKLHGSIDCWWVSGDAAGATIVRSPGGWIGHDDPSYARIGAVPGRSPFLVPPAAGKSQFYRNPLTREVWQRAAMALQEASTVDLVGYSVPITDLVTSGMFVDRLAGRDVLVRVINPSPGAPVDSLRGLGLHPESPHTTVEAYVSELERLAADRATAVLADLDEQLPVLIGTAQVNLARAIGCCRQPIGVRLDVEPFDGCMTATRSASNGGDPPITVAELRRELAGQTQVAVELPGANPATVISWEHLDTDTGYGAGKWAVGILSASPPRPESHRTASVSESTGPVPSQPASAAR